MFPLPPQHIPLFMPDLVSIEVVGKVHAGSRVKKYHLLENESSKYSFQKQVKVVAAAGEAGAESVGVTAGSGGKAGTKAAGAKK